MNIPKISQEFKKIKILWNIMNLCKHFNNIYNKNYNKK